MVDKTSYGFEPQFESTVVALSIDVGRFYDVVAVHLDPECMTVPLFGLVLKAVQAIAKEAGHGGTAHEIVLQRLERWREEGTVEPDEIAKVKQWMRMVTDGGRLPSWEQVAAEVVPTVKKRKHHELLREAMADEIDLGEMGGKFSQVDTIGVVDTSIGDDFLQFDEEFFGEGQEDLLVPPTVPLTKAMDGGLDRGAMGFYFGPSGSGKSMALNEQAVFSALMWPKDGRPINIALASTEIRERPAKERFLAGLTRSPKKRIKRDAGYRREAAYRATQLQVNARFMAKYFPGDRSSTPSMIEAWVDELEDNWGASCDLLLVDYADKLGHSKARRGESTYDLMGRVYESLRTMAIERQLWLWTAAQSVRRELKNEVDVYGINDVADSQNKVRVADIVVSLNPRDGNQIELNVCKNREGDVSEGRCGPHPNSFWCGLLWGDVKEDPAEPQTVQDVVDGRDGELPF